MAFGQIFLQKIFSKRSSPKDYLAQIALYDLSWSLKELKVDERKKRSAKQSARKRELFVRKVNEEELSMKLLQNNMYRGVHGGMHQLPKFTLGSLEEYLPQYGKKLEEKSKSPYKERRLN